MEQEVEIKIQITPEQLALLQRWLDKNTKFIGQCNQKDYFLDNPRDSFYFINADGKKDVLRFFRIRVASDGDSACYKNWHVDPETGNSTHCDEIEIKIADGMQMLELMQAVGFVNHRIKEKSRKQYVLPGFEILIDDVKDAGIFVEIEIDHQINDLKAGIESMYDLLRSIGITSFKKQIASCESKKMETVNL